MYSQNATFIELQYYWGSEHDPDFNLAFAPEQPLGFTEMGFTTTKLQQLKTALTEENIPFTAQNDQLKLNSPDGHPISVKATLN